MSSTTAKVNPDHSHLGRAWEIAIVIVFVVLVMAIVAAVLFQVRRKRRKRIQQEAGERDIEGGNVKNNEQEIREESIPESQQRMRETEVREPSPARLRDSNKSSTSYHEYISRKPPKYYWNQR